MVRAAWLVVALAACTGSDSGGDDVALVDATGTDGASDSAVSDASPVLDAAPASDAAPVINPGFTPPSGVTQANLRSGSAWQADGDADWGCLGTPSTDAPPSGPIALAGFARDFQTATGIGNVAINAYAIGAPATSLGTATSSDLAATRGQYATTLAALPAGTRRYTFALTAAGYRKTVIADRYLAPGAPATLDLAAVSDSTASALPALVGVLRDPTKGVMLGSIVDCQGRAVSNAAVTVSALTGDVLQPAGMTTFYFSASASSLPVRHSQSPSTNRDGLFMVVDVQPVATAYLQVWGFRTAAELASGRMTLLAETRITAEADGFVSAAMSPRRTVP